MGSNCVASSPDELQCGPPYRREFIIRTNGMCCATPHGLSLVSFGHCLYVAGSPTFPCATSNTRFGQMMRTDDVYSNTLENIWWIMIVCHLFESQKSLTQRVIASCGRMVAYTWT